MLCGSDGSELVSVQKWVEDSLKKNVIEVVVTPRQRGTLGREPRRLAALLCGVHLQKVWDKTWKVRVADGCESWRRTGGSGGGRS